MNERNRQADELRKIMASAKKAALGGESSESEGEGGSDEEDLHPADVLARAKADVLAEVGLREVNGEYVDIEEEDGEAKGMLG